MISAPWSPSICVQYGPPSTRERSITLMPARAPPGGSLMVGPSSRKSSSERRQLGEGRAEPFLADRVEFAVVLDIEEESVDPLPQVGVGAAQRDAVGLVAQRQLGLDLELGMRLGELGEDDVSGAERVRLTREHRLKGARIIIETHDLGILGGD